MGVRLRVHQVIERDDVDLIAILLNHGAEGDPADAPEAVDAHSHSHSVCLLYKARALHRPRAFLTSISG
jgi:hypothetical protein